MLIFQFLILIEEEGDKRKFSIIYDTYSKDMLKITYRLLGDKYHAEDAVQDSFLYIAKNIKYIETADSAKTRNYVYLIAKHKAIDIARKQKRYVWQELLEEKIYYDMDLAQIAINNIEVRNVLKALQLLKVSDRECLELNLFLDVPPKEIARILKISHSAARQRIVRAKRHLREKMEDCENEK